MAKVIKNLGQFAEVLKPQVIATLELVSQDIKKEIDDALQRYYDEYDPEEYDAYYTFAKTICYHRTDQLKNCCKIGKVKVVGNTMSIEIYLDVDSLDYSIQPGADPYKTVVSANAGLHGGWDVSVMEQIPWGMISSNDGTAYGNGTQIWKEPIEELFTKGKLIESFKRHAKARGLNLK